MLTQALADWVAHTRHALSAAQTQAVSDATVDTLGCIAAGIADPATLAVRSAIDAESCTGPARGIGVREPLPARSAALLNGTAAHALDFDDNFEPAYAHASAVLVPALLACAEQHDASGPAYADAYLVGLEVLSRLGRVMNPSHYQRGWHPTATLGVLGAAAACARLQGLDAATTRHALSIAFSLSAGSKAQFGTSAKPLHAGLAASNGLLACALAQAGMTGIEECLTGPLGLATLYHGRTALTPEAVLDGLGTDWALDRIGLMPKRFPCCAASHQSLDMLDALRQAEDIRPEQVQALTLRLPQLYVQNLRYDRPTSGPEARFSMPYTAACLLVNGTVRLADFANDGWQRPEITALYPRITIESLPHPDGAPPPDGSLTLLTTDGRRFERRGEAIKGTLKNPFTARHVKDKFIDCCALPAIQAGQAYRQARALLDEPALRGPLHTLWQDLSAHAE